MQDTELVYISLFHFCILLTEENKKIIPLTIVSKRINYLGLNLLIKEVKDLYVDTCKTEIKETEYDMTQMGKIYGLTDWKNYFVKMSILPKTVEHNPYLNTDSIFHRTSNT